MHHVYFEPQLLALRAELDFHPDLQMILRLQQVQDIYVHLAEIGAYLGVALNGTFTKDEVLKLCEMFTALLQKKREIIIL